MLDRALGIYQNPSASVGVRLLATQASSLRASPFSTPLQQNAEDAFTDHFARQDANLVVGEGARMFECARRDARLDPPVRHVLLQTLDRSLSRVCLPYRVAQAPLRKLAALDAWQATVKARVLDAIGRCESGCLPVPLSPSEQMLESKQRALLSKVWPRHLAMLEALCGASAMRGPQDAASNDGRNGSGAPSWLTCFARHLRRILFLTLDATLGASDVERLLAFVATPGGAACLTARAALGPWQEPASTPMPSPDPPEMTDLQSVMHEMIGEAAGADPTERAAYYTELAERMVNGVHTAL